MRQKVKVASLRTIKNRSERLAELEAERDKARKQAGKIFEQVDPEIRDAYQAMQVELAEERRDRQAADVRANETIIQLAEDRARLRKAITEALGGIGPGASCWGHTQYDKGYSAGGAVALTAFDAAIDAVGEKGGLQ